MSADLRAEQSQDVARTLGLVRVLASVAATLVKDAPLAFLLAEEVLVGRDVGRAGVAQELGDVFVLAGLVVATGKERADVELVLVFDVRLSRRGASVAGGAPVWRDARQDAQCCR
jgi:hypothetical protein